MPTAPAPAAQVILDKNMRTMAARMLGGFWDELLMRVTDVFLAFPALILAMAISAALGPSLGNVMIAVAAVSWPNYARLLRA